ncbi:MAG TPA: sugar hydrolase [Bacteroidales bacterium]|nr:MAG: sugar hydrolase [Bacteroidetes bacterium GWE2_42_24]OFY26458.1 MAG: sugar hydrolase [Bacteroidetes bacterium GWF2_43_11]HAQ65464.1 sugar hydrolase [Bacteroidales bacterium]HBZ68141.1 sugar hydrolase [Bacteroidales bacterium]
MKKYILLSVSVLIFMLLFSGRCVAQENARYINPFIGTDNMGHTFPGAVVPFGMVQLSPDTDTVPYSSGQGYNPDVYRYCAGYQYTDPTIVGFSHTHLHGTGHSDLGDFLLMPVTGEPKLNPGTATYPETGYRSRYDKNTEIAQAGYYAVTLTDYDIRAELTTTPRVGIHQYTFNREQPGALILDMVHGIYNYDGKVIWSSVRVVNDTLVTGYRQTNGWARERFIYFAMSFSRPITEYSLRNEEKEIYGGFWRRWEMNRNFPERSGRKVKAWFKFGLKQSDKLLVKMAISPVSEQGALLNLKSEAPHGSFGLYRADAFRAWNTEANRLTIDAGDEQKVVFYTALYHSLIHPSIYADVDGRYRGLDHEIHQGDGFMNYSIFSLWDTFRALHPWLTLMYPGEASDMVNSMLAHYDQSAHSILPVWSHYANDNWCMIGYHAVPVIADAWVKGIRGFDGHKALKAMVRSASYRPYEGLGDYMDKGYVPAEKSGSSASVTLEYAYDDYTISRMAVALGDSAIAQAFRTRSQNFEHLFDPATRFMRAMTTSGNFVTPFDALATHGMGYIEGNAWTYSLFVPQAPERLIRLMGGNKKFLPHLDSLFTMHLPEKYYANTEDIAAVGLMGNYVHGNEPGHHIPYLYNFAGKPSATQAVVRKILTTMYHNSPSGLCGNDDCGQMSAWYLFSSLGFYPFCPGTNKYELGAPLCKSASINLPGGRQLKIEAQNLTQKNIYVKRVVLNGKTLNRHWITHEEIMQGGTLLFEMTAKPHD